MVDNKTKTIILNKLATSLFTKFDLYLKKHHNSSRKIPLRDLRYAAGILFAIRKKDARNFIDTFAKFKNYTLTSRGLTLK